MKAIIFDMDGLMVDTERLYTEAARELARDFGKELGNFTLDKMLGRKPIEAMTAFAEDLDIRIPVERLWRIRDALYKDKLMNDIVPMTGLFEIINEFKGRLKMAVATGSAGIFLDIITERLNIKSGFDVMLSSDYIKKGKPDPEIYLKTIKMLEVCPGECVVLEDSSAGALAGKRAGCYTIAIPSEYSRRGDFSFVDYRAVDLNEAKEHIKSFLIK